MQFRLAVVLLILIVPACAAEMEILGTPLSSYCEDAANRSWDYWSGRLEEKPYDPQTFAWSLSYALRAFVKLYALTGNHLWLDRAVSWADHCMEYSDVNNDGRPAWGNYNGTWGREGYPLVESIVIDGMVALPIIELARLIHEDEELVQNQTLVERADAYTCLVTEIIEWRSEFWTDVNNQSGYYWNDPTNSEMRVVNRFATLGIVEMVLSDLLDSRDYLDRPRRMANYIKENLVYDGSCDCYWWPYHIGKRGVEDITHGSIDVEFVVRAYQHGLCFNGTDMELLVRTYQNRVWSGVKMFRGRTPFAMDVRGKCCLDYYQYAKNWPLLCFIDPVVLEQHRVALEVIARDRPGLHPDRVVAWTLAQMMELEKILADAGVDLGGLRAFTPGMIEPELIALIELVADAGEAGANVSNYENLLQELSLECQDPPSNPSVLLGEIWNATDRARRDKAGAYIALAEELVSRAREIGIDTSRHGLFLAGARNAYDNGNYESAWSLCDYPLGLEEQVVEMPSSAFLAFLNMGLIYLSSHRVPRS